MCTGMLPAEKVVFVTKGRTNGNVGGVAAADAMCEDAALSANLLGTFLAWFSDVFSASPTSPSLRFTQSTVPYVRTDGVRVANDWADLTDASIQNPIDRDEGGNKVGMVKVWTGTQQFGTANHPNCSDWTDSSALNNGAHGLSSKTDGNWSNNTIDACNNAYPLYCFEQ